MNNVNGSYLRDQVVTSLCHHKRTQIARHLILATLLLAAPLLLLTLLHLVTSNPSLTYGGWSWVVRIKHHFYRLWAQRCWDSLEKRITKATLICILVAAEGNLRNRQEYLKFLSHGQDQYLEMTLLKEYQQSPLHQGCSSTTAFIHRLVHLEQ